MQQLASVHPVLPALSHGCTFVPCLLGHGVEAPAAIRVTMPFVVTTDHVYVINYCHTLAECEAWRI
jgi:hypothetical protein